MTLIVRTLLLCTLFVTLNDSYAGESLRFIGEVNFPTGEKFQETEIGGLSGLTYDVKEKKLLAVSDDRSQVNEARFYEFDFALNEKEFSVKPTAVIKFKDQTKSFFKKDYPDFEGISLYQGDILVSSEGTLYSTPVTPPELFRFNRAGELKEKIAVPEKFLPTEKDKNYGTRNNKAFETLSTSLDGKTTFLAAEEALLQDGPISSFTVSSNVRMILYKNLKPVKEVAYPLEKIETHVTDKPEDADTGLADIAAIDDKTFYALERSYLPALKKNVIRIYKGTITKKTTNITKIKSLKDAKFVSVEKVLVSELSEFTPKMNPAKLDNIEGITLGPALSNGNRTLIVVSDNNFNKGQRTLFMAFEIVPAKK